MLQNLGNTLSHMLYRTLMYACALTMAYSFTFFFPTILVEMGFGPITAQLYAFIPYAVSMCTTLLICNLSDYFKHRYGFLMGGVLIGVVGYGILLSQKSNPGLPVGAKYFALFPLTIGAFTVQPMSQAWMMNNVGGRQKRVRPTLSQMIRSKWSNDAYRLLPVPARSALGTLVGLLRAISFSLKMRRSSRLGLRFASQCCFYVEF